MATFGNTALNFVRRNAGPAATALVTVTLIGYSQSFRITGTNPSGVKGTGSGSVVQQWGGSGGTLTGKMHSSGSLVLSGTSVVSHRVAGSGFMLIQGTDGGRVCVNDIDGTGCSCIAANNGVVQSWVGTGPECSPPDAL